MAEEAEPAGRRREERETSGGGSEDHRAAAAAAVDAPPPPTTATVQQPPRHPPKPATSSSSPSSSTPSLAALGVALVSAVATVAAVGWAWLAHRRREGGGAGGGGVGGGSRKQKQRQQGQQQAGRPTRKQQQGSKKGQEEAALRPRPRRRPAAAAPLPPPPPPPTLTCVLPLAATAYVSSSATSAASEGAQPSTQPRPLNGARLAVSEQVPLRGAPTGAGLGSSGGSGGIALSTAPATESAPFVARLVDAGASVVLHASAQPLNALFLPPMPAEDDAAAATAAATADEKPPQPKKKISAWASDPLTAPALGANVLNPAAAWRAPGGGSTAAAAAVASGRADAAAASDWLGEARIPAACMGLHAFLPTPGPAGPASAAWTTDDDDKVASAALVSAAAASGGGKDDGAAPTTTTLEAPALIARDAATLAAAADALDLPGRPGDLRHTLTQLVVADDLFELCDPALLPAHAASRAAALRWASAAQAGSVRLLPFLAQGVADEVIEGLLSDPHARAAARGTEVLTGGEGAREEDDGEEGGDGDKAAPLPPVNRPVGRPAPRLLLALHAAACVLRRADLAARYGDVFLTAAAADGEEAPQQQPLLPPPLLAELRAGRALPARTLALARRAASEVAETLRAGIKPDVVVLLPALPGPPPRLDAPFGAARRFSLLSARLAAIPSLAGLPSVWLPAGALAQGEREVPPPPLGVALMGAPRADRRLLAVCGAMRRFLDEAAAEVAAKARESAAKAAAKGDGGGQGAAAAAAASSSSPSKAKGANGHAATTSPSKASSTAAATTATTLDPALLEKAEELKARGNALFGRGKPAEAALEYTRAIRALGVEAQRLGLVPPSYFNNRAMAHLRAFAFEQAERDCDAALACAGAAPADRAKALLRRGTARAHLYRPDEAAADFAAVLRLEPNNRQAREELRLLRQQEREAARAAAAEAGRGGFGSGGFGGGGGGDGPDPMSAAAYGGGDVMQGLEMDPQELLADMIGRGGGAGGGPGAGTGSGGLGRGGGAAGGGGGGDTLVVGPGGMPVLMRADGSAVPLGPQEAADMLIGGDRGA